MNSKEHIDFFLAQLDSCFPVKLFFGGKKMLKEHSIKQPDLLFNSSLQ